MNNFYIYMYSDQNGVPFYIGKGSGDRFSVSKHLSNRQPFLECKIKKVGAANIKVHFLRKNLTEAEAFEFETSYIEHYGRRDLGKGTLCNLTDGGEGVSGISEETRQKISETMKGNQNAMGLIHSGESKRKMSETSKGQVPWNKGKTLSEKHKRKISETEKGKKLSEETIQKMKGNQNAKGYTHSKEAKKKISVAAKLYWTKKKMSIDREIIELDEYRCRVWGCGTRFNLQIHHIIPRSQGGIDKEWNMITLCVKHHDLITRKILTDIEMLEKIKYKADFRWQKSLAWHLNKANIRKP